MNIFHGTYHLDSSRFRLWGEQDSALGRKSDRRKIDLYAFVTPADQLHDWITNLVSHAQPELLSFTVWLPSTEHQPQASPEMRATGAFADNVSASSELSRWQVDGLELIMNDTLDLLLALAHRTDIGSSLHFWRAAALEALALVSKQQVIPALERDGFRYRAFWQPLPEHPERLEGLAAQMPPICRALAESPETALSPFKLLSQFVSAIVNSTIRDSATHLKLPSGRSVGAAWLTALTTADAQLKLPTADTEALFKSWQSWAGQTEAAGNSTFRIAFRLDAPEVEDNRSGRCIIYCKPQTTLA
ncbi:MAG: hypothetical protein H7175_02510 [Burkholderiales bacterium]|nr:hypothetical protein [Anaerolineae bacterium]